MLGPLVVASFVVDVDATDALWAAGAADSKALSAAKRVAVRARLETLGAPSVICIEPAQIDTGNLNQLEEEAIVELVRRARPDRVIVDALGHPRTMDTTIERLKARLGDAYRAEWVMEPKADANHAPVAAASIFAKTTRDGLLAALDAVHGPFGSGYPSDPVTRAWLLAWHKRGAPWPSFVRTRWKTIEALGQSSLF